MLTLLLLLLSSAKISNGQPPTTGCAGFITISSQSLNGIQATPQYWTVDFKLETIGPPSIGYQTNLCLAYKDPAVSTNTYYLIIGFQSSSTYSFNYVDTIHDPSFVMQDDNQDSIFGPINPKLYPPQESFSCHCKGGLGSWERSCGKYNLKDGLTCISDGKSYDVSGASGYNCSACFVNQVEHTAIGCSLGGLTSCHKMDFFNTTSYFIYKNDGLPSQIITSYAQYWVNSTLTSQTLPTNVNPSINLLGGFLSNASYNPFGSFVTFQESSPPPTNGPTYGFFGNNDAALAAKRANYNNLYILPEDYVGIYDMNIDKAGWLRGKSPAFISYDGGQLSEKMKTEYEFFKARGAKSAEISRSLYLGDISPFQCPKYQMRNIFGEGTLTSDVTSLDVELNILSEGVVSGRIYFPYSATMLFSSLIAPGVSSMTISSILCSTRNAFIMSSECNVTITGTGTGFISVVANNDFLNNVYFAASPSTYSFTISSDSFADGKTTICISSIGSNPVCYVGTSVFISNDEPINPTDPNGPDIADDNDGDEEGTQTDYQKTSFPVSWIVLITIGCLIILIVAAYAVYKVSFADCRKSMKRWKVKKQLRSQKEEKEFEQLMNEIDQPEKKEVKGTSSKVLDW